MSVLDVSGLSVHAADGRTLVKNVTFTVDTGGRFGLIGESGSGKSLTALAIMGLLPAGMTATGSVLLSPRHGDATQVIGAPEARLNTLRGRAATVVFQEPLTALDPLMRVGRQIAEPLRRHRRLRGAALRDAVLAALTEVRLSDPERISRAYPHQLSGGQRQRIAIAMALACEPALLIADEPTTALDVTVQAEILTLLTGLVDARGMALLFISHDLAVVAGVTDQVLVLKDGTAVESGALADIVQAPRDPYTQDLVASAREFDDALDWSTP